MDIRNEHVQAEILREEEKYSEALDLYPKVIAKYQKINDYLGETEAMGGMTLTYKHLYLLTKDETHLKSALDLCLQSLEIANMHHLDDVLHRLYFRLGEIQMIAGDYKNAVVNYEKSLSLWPEENAEKGHVIYHLGDAEYGAGKKETGIPHVREGISIIAKYEQQTDSFLFHVWLSGGYMTLAKILRSEKLGEAKSYLAKAKEIIDNDPRLIIRRRQLEELAT